MKDESKNNLISISRFSITSADTDMAARIRLGSLVNLLIQSAIISADSMGFGFDNLRKQKLFWVLSRLTVEIYRPLQWYEEVEVETWPKNIERILYLRDFLIRNKKQEINVKATSGWLPIDLITKRPRKINGIHEEIFVNLKNKYAIKDFPERLDKADGSDSFEVNSTYYDIDLNKHVTSTRYIDWMMDTLPVEFHLNNYPQKLSINYMKETMPGETVKILRRKLSNNQFQFEGINSSNESNAFRGKIEF